MPANFFIHAERHRLQPIWRHILCGMRNSIIGLLVICLTVESVRADSITYQQLRQNQNGRAATSASVPEVMRTQDAQAQGQDKAQNSQQAGTAQESATHPEFVRLPDGRIVRYGPGIICDENCIEPVAPAAFRGPGPGLWWILPPVIAGGILCAVLCRPDRDNNPQPTPTIIIPPASPTPTATVGPTATPTATPPPTEIPEPGTLLLFGAGLSALLARKRMAAKKQQDG